MACTEMFLSPIGPLRYANEGLFISPANANSVGGYGNYQVPSAVAQAKKAAATPPQPPPPPQLTAEQKLAAARIALRKQLEHALQQVPSPKPPPPEVNFLPSLASGEFVYLIGMEVRVLRWYKCHLIAAYKGDISVIFMI